MSAGWNLYIAYLSFFNQNVANCQNTLTVVAVRWRILLQDVRMRQMMMTDAGTTQDNVILPAPPVGGLPISHDWLDRMKLVRNRIILFTLPSGKKIYWLIQCLKSL